jgi:hypothetical protein
MFCVPFLDGIVRHQVGLVAAERRIVSERLKDGGADKREDREEGDDDDVHTFRQQPVAFFLGKEGTNKNKTKKTCSKQNGDLPSCHRGILTWNDTALHS